MSAAREPSITVSQDGPYRVAGSPALVPGRIVENDDGDPVAWELGDAYPTGRRFTLCRCGRSATKPFCDDSHLEGFDGTESADRGPTAERRRRVDGEALTLTDDLSLCSNAGFCMRSTADVWRMTLSARSTQDQANVAEIVAHCPSGRLELEREDARAVEPGYEPSIVVEENGPYWVRDRVPIESADGTTWEVRNRVALCRCGESSNKPFCDGTHRRIGFSDSDGGSASTI